MSISDDAARAIAAAGTTTDPERLRRALSLALEGLAEVPMVQDQERTVREVVAGVSRALDPQVVPRHLHGVRSVAG